MNCLKNKINYFKMNKNVFTLIRHIPTKQVFRAVYFDGTHECFNNILPLINKYHGGFVETSNPIKLYYHRGSERCYSLILPANHWMIAGWDKTTLKEKYNIDRCIDDDTFNKLFEYV